MRELGLDLSHLDRLLGDVLLEGEIARTPLAAVFRIRTGGMGGGRPLALKVARQPSDAEDLARFRHEVRLLSETRHPNVVEVYDFGVLPGDFPFLTMELLSGGNLAAHLRERGWDAFWEAAIQAAAGLAHIHRQGVVHMDLKPANLGLAGGAEGRPVLKILDFGLAQERRGALDRRIRGTLAYTAPEVLLQDDYDHRADLYSLGMTLYELATGVLPSAGEDREAIRFHLEGELPDPLALRPGLPPALARILVRLLRRDPGERYASAGRLLADLATAAGRPIDAAGLSFGEEKVLASRLVCRDEALGQLRADLAEAAAGQGGAVVIEGEEGVGKSRLLREFRLFAAIEGARIGRGNGTAEAAQPLGPFVEALRSVGLEVRSLAPSAPAGELIRRARFRLYREIALDLAAHAQTGPPLVLLLDDLHLAGIECEELLRYLGEELCGFRVLVVASRRPAEGEARDDEAGPLRKLALAPFGRSETAHLIDACLGTANLPASFYAWVHEATRGVPGQIQRLLRHLVDDGVLQYRDGDWKPSLPALARWGSSPGGREAQEWQRLQALSPDQREVLNAAAVIAEAFSLALLSALLGQDSQNLYERLSSLVEQGHLERLREAGGAQYHLPQRRFQQALYAELDGERRVALHGRLAALLEERLLQGEPGLTAAVAEHFWRGGDRARSLPHLLRAAAEATAVYGYAQAASFYGRAAEAAAASAGEATTRALAAQAESLEGAGLYPRALRVYQDLLARPELQGEDRESLLFAARLSLRQGRLYTRLGEHAEALASHEKGLRLISALDEPELEADLMQGKSLALRDLGDWEAAFQTARAALAHAHRQSLERQRANLLNTLGMLYSDRGDWRRAGRLTRRGLWVAERCGDTALCLTLRNNLGNVLWKTGRFEEALDLYRRNLAQCEQTHDLWGELFALNNLGIMECSRGNWLQARDPLVRSADVARRLGARENEALSRLNLGEVEEVLGNWARAERHYERALKLLEDMPEHPDRFAVLAQLASLERKRGRSVDAERRAREALAGAEKVGDRDLLAACYFQLGLVEKDRDDLEPAANYLLRALDLWDETGTKQSLARVHLSLADLAMRDTDLGCAENHAAQARQRIEEMGDRFNRAKLYSIEARLASARDEVEAAERLFAEGVRLLEELETPYEHARSLYEWGLRTWSFDTALRRLRRALAGFERLGAETELRRASGALDRIREHQRLTVGRGASEVLYEVVKVINSTLDLQEVLSRTLDLVLERLGAQRGMIVLANRLTRELEVAVTRNLGGDIEEEGRLLSESVVRRVIESREPVLAVDAMTDGRFSGAKSIIARHIVSLLCVPLAIKDRLAGAIYVDHRESRHLFGQSDLEFLVAFADQAAVAIENARLYSELEASRLHLKEENESLRSEILSRNNLGSLIGKSRVILDLRHMLEKVAQSPSTVLVRGESGTGKGLVARTIHSISPRRQAPFIHFNCAALPETLVESELFGHEKGAFTGAAGLKPGRFELANHGTIFLDEIGKVSMSVQSKLLRVVEEKEFERVGGTRTLKSDVRIIAATNLDLEEAIERKEFREDLYYRLNIVPILLPPLRERKEDIPYLVEHFLTKISRDLGRPAKDLDEAVLDLFLSYSWPGNVRELEAAIHRACVLAAGDTLTVTDFGWIALNVQGPPAALARPPEVPGLLPTIHLAGGGYEEALERYDRQLITAGLAQCGGKIRETARLLGIARNTLRAKMKKYGLSGTDSGEAA
ncbi:MAG TPA: sigma 54-interacting transcriptional regulator [Thermoanaerobaculia bacterium]|nr:sigma 54-interacting transcriptional regulator [Thermoanaerobaculia bacterium]